jgi:hypothetical protein
VESVESTVDIVVESVESAVDAAVSWE